MYICYFQVDYNFRQITFHFDENMKHIHFDVLYTQFERIYFVKNAFSNEIEFSSHFVCSQIELTSIAVKVFFFNFHSSSGFIPIFNFHSVGT